MNRPQAIKLYLKRHVHSESIIQILMKWDSNKTIKQLSLKMKKTPDLIRGLAVSYGLKYEKEKHKK